jgi:acyl-CoA thioesterase II
VTDQSVRLADILRTEEVAADVYRAWTPPRTGRSDIFGGQVAGQALRAALHTAQSDHLPNSVHGYFLRRGQPELPLDIHVERIRAGRTYTSRRVDVRQGGRTIFAMLASLHAEEPGREFDHPMPDNVPDPDEISGSDDDRAWNRQMDIRNVEGEGPIVQWWGRVIDDFPADPAMHYCALLYASDLRAGGAAMSAVGYGSGNRPDGGEDASAEQEPPLGNFGSLDHAVWFHRLPDVRDWFFCDVRPLTVRDSRGLVLGRMFDRMGRHLATFTQEMFLKGVDGQVAPTT